MLSYKIHHFKSLASTQDKAKELAEKGLSNLVVVADVQKKGRGRFRRKWFSGKGGLWMSILLKPKNPENLQYLTFAASVAVAETIKKTAKFKASIKWPNDVHCKGKKLCGILTEGVFGKENYAAVGIGLNVNQEKFPNDIRTTAASLKSISGKIFNNNHLLKSICNRFFYLYFACYDNNKLKNILKIWKKYCDTVKKNVVVITTTKRLEGRVLGVDKNCNLLLKLKNNRIVKIIEGDVRVRYQP